MSVIFIGGSRHISRLPPQAEARLKTICENNLRVIVGDANGVDKAVQHVLAQRSYSDVTVFCSGKTVRNNIGDWPTCPVIPPNVTRGFQFYAAKDREMARQADFGLMIWDGKSPGTVLNLLRLIGAGKKAVLIHVPNNETITMRTAADWQVFLTRSSQTLQADLRERATLAEWTLKQAPAYPEPQPVA